MGRGACALRAALAKNPLPRIQYHQAGAFVYGFLAPNRAEQLNPFVTGDNPSYEYVRESARSAVVRTGTQITTSPVQVASGYSSGISANYYVYVPASLR